ncbi:MAG: ABC transporter substrate-binding protein [Coriobacteriia bacterium]
MGRSFRRGLSVLLLVAVVAIVAPTLTACSAQDGADQASTVREEPVAAFPVTVTDDLGREVTVDSEPQRIVSLAPANTEILYGLGLLDRVVGVTSFDDYPPEVADLPKVGDFVGPNVEAVAALEPDLVLATGGVQQDVIEQIEGTGATVIAVDPQSVEGLYESIRTVGAVTGVSEAADALVVSMQEDIAAVQSELQGVLPVTVFVEIAQDPLFTAGRGTLIDELITLAGGTNVVKDEGYVGYSVEQLLEDDPEFYLATLGSMSDPAALQDRPGYGELSAVKNGNVGILTDNLVSRPGPRITEGIREIAGILHPDVFGED